MKNTSLKNSIGLSQDEIAIVLGINRSQWSMYESGLRDLPLEAKKKLSLMVGHIQKAKGNSSENKKHIAVEEKRKQEWLQQQYAGLHYSQELLDRKILAAESKRSASFAALEAVRFLETESSVNNSLLKTIQTRAENTLKKNSLQRIEDFKIRKEQLGSLKLNLEGKIIKNNSH